MTGNKGQEPVETSPAVLVRAVEAAVERYFAGLDLEDESRRLGLGAEVLPELRARLLELRDVALRAEAAESGGGAR
jgi:hypothetical protein